MASTQGKDGKSSREVLDSSLIKLMGKEDNIPLDLYTASLIGDYQVVRDLIGRGTDINKPNRSGWTPLIYSAYVGKDTVVNLLLESGVDIDATVPDTAMNAMMHAASCGNESVVYFLLQQGCYINQQDKRGRTSLFHAANRGHVNVVKLLLDQSADMEIRDSLSGNTPLIETAVEGYEVIFSLLLEHGANMMAKNRNGETAQLLATRYGNTMIVNLIEQKTRGKNVTSLRSEAGLGDGLQSKILNFEEKNNLVLYVPTDAWNSPSGLQSYPPRTGASPPNYTELSSRKTDYHLGPLRSRDIISPIDPSDHEPPSQNFCSLESEPEDILSNHFKDNAITKKEVDRKKDNLWVGKGQQNEAQRRLSPKQNKASRVFTDMPTNVQCFEIRDGLQSMSLSKLLKEINLSKYLHCFEQNGIDFSNFLAFTDEGLKEIGIDKLGPRKKILSAIQRYNNDRKKLKNTKSDQPHEHQLSQDPSANLQQAHTVIKQLESQLYKEQLTRVEMEAYFVSEQGRLTRIMHLAAETKRDCKESLKKLDIAQQLQMDISGRINALKDADMIEEVFPVTETQKNIVDVQRCLEGQLVSLNTNLTVALRQVEQILKVLQVESLSELQQQSNV